MMSARCFLVRCSTSNCSSCRPAPPGWNRTFKNGYLLSKPLISSAPRSLAIAAYHMISPSLRASFSRTSARALSSIRLICSSRFFNGSCLGNHETDHHECQDNRHPESHFFHCPCLPPING